MTISSRTKSLLDVALLSSSSSFAAAGVEENSEKSDSLAPEATAADASISFRDIPYLKKALIDAVPADRKGALVVGELGVDGGKGSILASLIAVAATLAVSGASAARDFPIFEGPYLGQTPPGTTAEVFAPGVISTDGWEVEAVFAPGMQEFYFVTDGGIYERPTIIGFQQLNNQWRKFTEMPRTGEPYITADGQTMHLAKGYRVRTADGWSDVKSLGPMFDHDDWGIMRLTASNAGTYVFDDYKSGGAIRISKLVDGKRQPPELVGEQFNTGELTAHPFIAPDESYLIWDSKREGGFGASDLYISFRQDDGSWGPAINMGPKVNSDKADTYASVTSDGKFLMFNRTIEGEGDTVNVDIYWVDAGIIENLRRKATE